jgi:hypothetical protein
MKILAISDTHAQHSHFPKDYFDGIDMVIHAGDESNYRDPIMNEFECFDFLNWYKNIPVKYKIFVAGNHSLAIFNKRIPRKFIEDMGVIYLENESVEIEGINIWGSPYSPTFGDWWFMKARDKINDIWKNIPENTNILITHTPPKGILDLSFDREGTLEFCGCKSLMRHVERVQPSYHIFGHIHTMEGVINAGIRTLPYLKTKFINASCVTDGKFNMGLSSMGEKFEFNK